MHASPEEILKSHRLVPVIEIGDVSQAVPLGNALMSGGLPVAEVTFRSAAAPESIKRMREIPGLCVGAGTIINIEQARQALDCGASYFVSPGLFPKVVAFAQEKNIPIYPGVATPTDIGLAIDLGVTVLKFFPAEALGGLKTLKAFSAPFPQVKFVPTGGINETNLAAYLAHPKVVACGGSWMVEKALVTSGRFDEVAKLAAAAVALAREPS
ncbi:MAG: bifunctional 4-hydroxy-2-oxoglutarate aldolase/2-dehydro-3-deoxy-phosphogluconate aldolase [Opitutaceae bacterium]